MALKFASKLLAQLKFISVSKRKVQVFKSSFWIIKLLKEIYMA